MSFADLREADLQSAILDSVDLRNANAQRTRLQGVDLRTVRIEHADFRNAKLQEACLSGINLSTVNLAGADLSDADMHDTDITGGSLPSARLHRANLERAVLRDANFAGADFRGATLTEATLIDTNLAGASLRDTNLQRAILVKANLEKAVLSGAAVYGISVWDVNLDDSEQLQLLVTPEGQPPVRVDHLAVAQFIYLLLHNKEVRQVIDSITTSGVLILGRFTDGRKEILDGIRERLRERGFVPIMFDLDKPRQRDFTETIKVLAGLSRFIIADITNPRSSPLELQAVVPDYMIPLVPIIQQGEEPFAMFRDLRQKYGTWVLDPLEYDSVSGLLDVLDNAIVAPAIKLSEEIARQKAMEIRMRHVRDYKP